MTTFSTKYISRYCEKRNRFYKKCILFGFVILNLILGSCALLNYSDTLKYKLKHTIKVVKLNINNMKKEKIEQSNTKLIFENYNLEDLYENENAFNEDIENIRVLALDFAKIFAKTQIKNTTTMVDIIKKYEKISQIAVKLQAYSYLKYSIAVNSEENTSRLAKTNKALSEVDSNTLFFKDKIIKLSQKDLTNLTKNSPFITEYHPFLKKIRQYSGHTMSIQTEKYSSEKSIIDSAIVRFYDEKLAKISIKYKNKNITLTEALKKLEDENPNVRNAISKKLDQEFENISDDAFFALKTIIDSQSVEDKYRNFASPESSMHISNGIDKEIIDNLINVVVQNYTNTSHKYYDIKRKIMKKKILNLSDRNAKLFDTYETYSVSESQNIIKLAYSELGSDINEMLEEFFTKPWIDYYNKAGKQGGAFCYPIANHHPYLMLNHFGSVRDVLTFAHEIGHGIHEYSVAKNGPLMNRNPLIFAETASVFSEFLIFDLMLKKVQTKEEKVALLMQKIEDQLNTVGRQTAFFRFEKLLHELAKTKPLVKKDVQDIWMQVQKESLGNSFIFHDAYKNYWVYVSHFFHSPFYVYAYVFGDLFASAMYDSYKKDPIEFAPKYKKFLQKTSVANYQEVFSIFDFQKGTTDFWQNSLNYTIKLIEELEFII